MSAVSSSHNATKNRRGTVTITPPTGREAIPAIAAAL
jgi:hypothetical protein